MSQSLQQPETIELLNSARKGSQDAWKELYHRHRAYLIYRLEMKIPGFVQRSFDAEDIIQDGFFAAWKQLDRFQHRGPGSFLGWLTRIVVNECQNEIRSRIRERESLKLDTQAFRRDEVCQHEDGGQGPADVVAENEVHARIRRAFNRLSEEDQQIIALRVSQKRTMDAFAEILGCPRSTAQDRFSRAFDRLRQLSKEPSDD